MARKGAFSANFDPVLLDEFRSFCNGRGEKYTKILEQLAALYLNSKGEVLANQSVPTPTAGSNNLSGTTDHERRLSKLEEADEYNEETFATIFQRLLEVEKATKTGQFRTD